MKTTTTPSPPPPPPLPKRFASVRDLVKATAADDEQIREFDRRLADSLLVNALIRTRASAGMTQADLSSNSADHAILQNINGFFGEAWFNLFKILCDATSKLPEDTEQEDESPLKLLGAELKKFTVTGKQEEVCA